MIDADVLENTPRALSITHAYTQGNPEGVPWPSITCRSKGPTRADIEQLPVAHAHIQWNPEWVTWPLVTSGSPAVMRNDTFCTTTLVRKKRGKKPGMRRICFRSLPVRAASSGHVTSGSSTSLHLLNCGFVRYDILLIFLRMVYVIWSPRLISHRLVSELMIVGPFQI